MQGPADLIRAVEDPGRYGEGYLKNIASDFLPFFRWHGADIPRHGPAHAAGKDDRERLETEDSGDVQDAVAAARCLGRGDSSKPWAPAGRTAIYMQGISQDPVAPAKVERKVRNIELTDREYATSPELPAGSPRCGWARS
jgi:hypothetical protein